MKKIRLAIVRQKYRPDGGAERFISRALEALNHKEMELNVITRQWQGDAHPDWKIHLCNPFKWGRISRERGFAKAARKLWLQQKFDIVQSHERIPGCDIYRAGDGVHRRWLLQRSRILAPSKQRRLMADRYHRYVMQAEKEMYTSPTLKAVICNAAMIKQEIIEDFAVPAEKIHVIYNAIDAGKFCPPTPGQRLQLRQQHGIPQDAHCLVFVGSGFERKGLKAAIQAIAATTSHLLVVGKDKMEQHYRQLASDAGCQDRVHFAGMQPQTLDFYQLADGLLLPTLYDPFPNVILEAMACGLPVITSTHCGGAEFITEGRNGFVTDALDIAAMIQAIKQLPKQALGSEMGYHARETILPYTPDNLSQQLFRLYEQIVA